jgi:predicted phage-related endonuclease
MGTHELTAKLCDYKKYSELMARIEKMKDGIANEVKTYMSNNGIDTMTVGEYKVSYTDCFRRDIDKKALANDHADLYADYLKETIYKRFTVA